jgi:formate/nitrite transporter FocA (FNT family)
MAYLIPSEFVTKMVDAGESKVFMSTRDTVIRAYMAGAILALAAWFAIMVSVQTGYPIIGAILFPVGFCMLYLLQHVPTGVNRDSQGSPEVRV